MQQGGKRMLVRYTGSQRIVTVTNKDHNGKFSPKVFFDKNNPMPADKAMPTTKITYPIYF